MAQFSVSPDTHTFPFALKACAHLRSLSLAKSLHCQALKVGFLDDVFAFNNLIHAYCVSGDACGAHNLFDENPYRDLVSYNAMIDGFVKAGYAKMNQCREAIQLFDQMLFLDVKPDNTALVAVLSACAQLGELEKGKTIHEYILQNRNRINEYLITGLVDFYGKCGYIDTARGIFESSTKNLCTWNAMLVGLAMHGHGNFLLDYFARMVDSGVKPDRVTFLGVLVGCSHAGLVNEARKLFAEMEAVYGVPRELKHYGCMADLLGRAGLIKEAVEMIETMPMQGDVYVWGGLLGGCRMHGDIEAAEKAASQLVAVKPEDGGVYSVLANLYANAERWDDLVKMRSLREGGQIRRNAGCSLIQLNGETHEFVAGDDLHPLIQDIYTILNVLEQHKLEALC
ncbi:OLC1v1014447C1 [Oldenlandia corymbosa var. corymbosa]|uniref:OLC1v1014447C1 n=1 Tax=Oldenlandia corymbosa var. corymbosa TaxID=529605 RepID=A0AAV1E0S8_OLDCO|nr:OLC1v1014447C1 [Oldenlandia corymbosa var. corymbosa]